MLDELLKTAMVALVSCLVGLFTSLFPLKLMLERKFAESKAEAEKIKEFEIRRKSATKDAVSAAGKAFFWLERGCKLHDPLLWNGELHNAVLAHKEAEDELKKIEREIVDTFSKEHY